MSNQDYLIEHCVLIHLYSINNCDYFVSSQLLSFVLIDLVFTVIGALKPFVTFKVSEYYGEVIKAYKLRFAHNFFEPIDEFCE